MTTVTTDKSELIMPALVRHLIKQKPITDSVGRAPSKIFPGPVPDKIEERKVVPPWVKLERGAWTEEKHFGGRTGTFMCPTVVVVIAQTIDKASQIYASIRHVCDSKWSETWGDDLWVCESDMSLGTQVPLLEADGMPSPWEQLVGELWFMCKVLP